jgi:predicted RNA-binding protein with TRAM domain
VTLGRRKVKRKVVFVHDMKEYEEMEVEVHSVSNAALNGGEASA